mgnify:CR=1 FL=1
MLNINNIKQLNILFNEYKPDAILHFGALSEVSESVTNPYKYYKNNVSGTINLLKAMLDHDCNKIIFSSTAAVFGNPKYIPIDENHPKNPINPYGRSKLMVEQLLEDFDLAYGLKYLIFRYFNVYGRRQPTKGQYAPVVGIFLRQNRKKQQHRRPRKPLRLQNLPTFFRD